MLSGNLFFASYRIGMMVSLALGTIVGSGTALTAPQAFSFDAEEDKQTLQRHMHWARLTGIAALLFPLVTAGYIWLSRYRDTRYPLLWWYMIGPAVLYCLVFLVRGRYNGLRHPISHAVLAFFTIIWGGVAMVSILTLLTPSLFASLGNRA